MATVVVGVDGSEHSQRALECAMSEARLRGALLDVVHVYRSPGRRIAADLASIPIGAGLGMGSISLNESEEADREASARSGAQAWLSEFVDRVADGADAPQLTTIAADNAAEALTEYARDAALLVIGTRGLGGFAGLLLGSVAHQCIQHATCPVLVVPAATD